MKLILTERQEEVTEQIVEGKPAKLIADALFTTIDTIKSHKSNIFKANPHIKNSIDLVREYIIQNPKKYLLIFIVGLQVFSFHHSMDNSKRVRSRRTIARTTRANTNRILKVA